MTTLTGPKNGRLVNLLRRARRLWRAHGFGRVLYAACRRGVSNPVLRRVLKLSAAELCHVTLSESNPTARAPGNYVVRTAGADDFQALAEYYGNRQRVHDRFARGNLCVVTLCQGQLGAAVWIATGPAFITEDENDLRCVFRIPAGTGWSYDGKGTKLGAWGALMAKLPTLLQDRDIQELRTLIECNNWKSLDAHRSLGYRTIGILVCARAFGFALTLCKRPTHRWHRLPVGIGPLEVQRRVKQES